MGRGEVHTGFWWGNTREGDHLEDLGINRRTISKWIIKNSVGEGWIGLIWLRILTGVRLM